MKIQKNKKVYEEIKMTESATEAAVPVTSEVKETETKEKAEVPVNFDELWDINPEIYAWIEIPGTDVNYPIAQRL